MVKAVCIEDQTNASNFRLTLRFSMTFWRCHNLFLQFQLQIFRQRVGIFSHFFLCCFYFLFEVHVNFFSMTLYITCHNLARWQSHSLVNLALQRWTLRVTNYCRRLRNETINSFVASGCVRQCKLGISSTIDRAKLTKLCDCQRARLWQIWRKKNLFLKCMISQKTSCQARSVQLFW